MSKIYKDRAAAASEPFRIEDLDEASIVGEVNIEDEAGRLEKMRRDIETREREAYEKGFAAGEKAGFELGAEKAKVYFSGMEGVLNHLTEFRESIYVPCEKEMVALCLTIAKKVIHREVEVNKDVVLGSVRAALKAVVAGSEVVIRVNAKDLEVINQYKSELMKFSEGVKGVVVEGDDTIARGGCVVDTNYGEIDVTMNAILGDIEESLRNAY